MTTTTTVPPKLGIVQIEIATETVAEIGTGMGATETVITGETGPEKGQWIDRETGTETETETPVDDTQDLAPGTANQENHKTPKTQNPLLLLPKNGV